MLGALEAAQVGFDPPLFSSTDANLLGHKRVVTRKDNCVCLLQTKRQADVFEENSIVSIGNIFDGGLTLAPTREFIDAQPPPNALYSFWDVSCCVGSEHI